MTSLRGKQRKERNINKQLYVDKQKYREKQVFPSHRDIIFETNGKKTVMRD